MIKCIWLLAAIVALTLSATASADIVLDLNLKEGDQKVREARVKPGKTVQIEVFAQKGAQDIQGVEIVLRFDAKKITYKDFKESGLMEGAFSLPAKTIPGQARISLGFLGKKSPRDAGRLGILQIELSKDLGESTKIELIKGSYGIGGKVRQFDLSSSVKLINAKTSKKD